MKTKLWPALFSWVVIFSGCTILQVNSEFGSGREAYLAGNNDVALSYFQSTAQKDSAYTYYGYAFRQGIWSYVGRTEYAIGRFPQARQSLERALAKAWEYLRPNRHVVIMDGKLAQGLLGRLSRPGVILLCKATVLGNPDRQPWEDLKKFTPQVEMEEINLGTYYICRGTKL